MSVPSLEKQLGIEVYASPSPGVGGKIRQFPEDFVVEEILVDGSQARISPVEAKQPERKGRYLICVLVKRDWDTLLAVKKVAERLRVRPKHIQIAGIKDAHALTAQHISIRHAGPDQVSRIKIKDITLHPLRFSQEMVFSHLLFGNRFRVLIRSISHAPSFTEQRVEKVRSEVSRLGGVPNFFGHQRFGTVRPITHLVGRFITQSNWKEAALTFLAQPSLYEHPESREARQQLRNTRNFREGLRLFPRYLRYERLMLTHLTKRSKDFVGAFRKLPLKLRRIFIQAYQSFLFNRSLSERVKRGISIDEVQVGDYVVSLDDHGIPKDESALVTSQSLSRMKKGLKGGLMRVAIPLLGFKQKPSGGKQGEIEHDIIETENVAQRNFHVNSMPEISTPGRLRAILAPPIDLFVEHPTKDTTDSCKLEMQVNFTFHRGSYATVLLREFMKPRDLIEAGF
ncbi:MAG: tRNA pseudouridine(13) synthase TruD [Candidatus Bathyarchaeota archaeon]|nr:MAG: tRNA pseudouridine(13) synthase TruD [Candidatus Bathyarchaeota archaeon]